MLRLLADENFNDDIVRGLMRRLPGIDVIRVREAGLTSAEDPEVLRWAADNGRIVLTHDRATMSVFAFDRLMAGQMVAGVFIVNDRFPVSSAIQEILLMIECSSQDEWKGRVVHLPL